MKCVAMHVHGSNFSVGFVCDCGHYGIIHVHRRVRYEADHMVEHPALTLDGALPIHREILDRLHELGKW